MVSQCGKGHPEQIVPYMQEQVISELRLIYKDLLKEDLSSSLPEALLQIHTLTQEKFIIIIDEWDCLFREEKYNTTLQEEYINFLRGMFKGQPAEEYIRLAYITGILPIKKYGTQSALNHFDEYTMVNPRILAEYVGFTEKEVQMLCQTYHMDFREAKRWYDGYSFNKVKSICGPSSVTQAMRNEEYGNYWTETETYESLKLYIDLDLDGLKETLLQMLGGAHCPMDTGTFQNDMTSIHSKAQGTFQSVIPLFNRGMIPIIFFIRISLIRPRIMAMLFLQSAGMFYFALRCGNPAMQCLNLYFPFP